MYSGNAIIINLIYFCLLKWRLFPNNGQPCLVTVYGYVFAVTVQMLIWPHSPASKWGGSKKGVGQEESAG